MLVNLNDVLKIGRERGIGVGAVNTPNLETLCAVIKVAEELDIPVIVSHAQIHEFINTIDVIGPIMLDLASKAKVPVCVHLDHGETVEFCKKAIDLGFTSVMIDASTMAYEDNIRTTKEVVEYAHSHGATVEAELGQLPNREDGGEGVQDASSLYTNPELVPDFVSRTGIDALAIAFGTAHGIYKVKPILNIDIIKQVRAKSDIHLVMHGGSGLSFEDYQNAIKAGINKINYYTYMNYEGYAACKEIIERNPTGFYHDLTVAARDAQATKIKEILKVFSNK